MDMRLDVKKTTRWAGIIMCIILIITPMTSCSSHTMENGLTWTLKKGELIISGNGAMDDYYETLNDPFRVFDPMRGRYTSSEIEMNAPPWESKRNDITSIVIKDGVTRIGEYAFKDCDNLVSVVIPNSVTAIGDCAFISCDKLSQVTIPNHITWIGTSVFADCASLINIAIPDGVRWVGEGAFSGCSNLTSASLPGSAHVADNAFPNATELWYR